MMTKDGSTKIVNFMTPGAGVFVLGRDHISHVVKMRYLNLFFFKSSFLLPGIDQTNQVCIVMMNKEGSTEIVNFMTLGTGVLVQVCGICHYSEYVLSSTLMMLLSYTIVDFYLVLDGANMSPSDKKSVKNL